jgi:uncharacterized protein YqeY
MGIKQAIQDAMKDAMKHKDHARLECLRMAKGALILKEKEKGGDITEEDAVAALRGEVRKRHQTAATMREVGRGDAAAEAEREIEVIESFLPRQLDEQALEARVRAFVAEHPDVSHAGKLTGMLKKELGDQADGKMLNDVCRRVLEG